MVDDILATARLLREYLTRLKRYRSIWMAYAQRRRSDEISYAAVSQVLALHMWDRGIRADTERDLPRKLRDRTRQALRGEQLTYETLTLFIEAFSFTDEDTQTLLEAYAGSSGADLGDRGIAFTLRKPPIPLVVPQRHRTVALFVRYHIDANHALQLTETSHAIVALEEGIDSFAYSPRDSVTDVTVVTGGTFAGYHESAPGYVGVRISLSQRLTRGQRTSLQYATTHRPDEAPCTYVRRAARRRIENVDMRVLFDEVRPTRAWWCVWGDYDCNHSVERTPIQITSNFELHQFVPYAEETVMGFQWEW